jgi:hypothetical protein
MTQPTTYQVPAHPSGLDMRTLVNTIILALVGDNAGPIEPPETYPGMWWGDTTASRLRHRTTANDGWVDVGPLDDPLGDFRGVIPSGTIVMWWGDGTKIPAGWKKCDGTNGTPDMRDRLPTGAGGSLALGGMAGANTMTLTTDHLPNHAHSVYDPGHTHGFADPGHAHGVGDPAHAHSLPNYGSVQAGADNGGAQCPVSTGYSSGRGQNNVNAGGTGIWIGANGTGAWTYAAGTSIGIYAAGGSAAWDKRPAVTALWFLMKI